MPFQNQAESRGTDRAWEGQKLPRRQPTQQPSQHAQEEAQPQASSG